MMTGNILFSFEFRVSSFGVEIEYSEEPSAFSPLTPALSPLRGEGGRAVRTGCAGTFSVRSFEFRVRVRILQVPLRFLTPHPGHRWIRCSPRLRPQPVEGRGRRAARLLRFAAGDAEEDFFEAELVFAQLDEFGAAVDEGI